MSLEKIVFPVRGSGESIEAYVDRLIQAILRRDDEIRVEVNRNEEKADSKVRGWMGL